MAARHAGATRGVADSGQPARPGPGAHDGPVAVISPLVRRLARENGLDLRELTGSGPDGLILRADVEHAACGAGTAAAGAAAVGPRPAPAAGSLSASRIRTAICVRHPRMPRSAGERVPLRGVRGAVADKLSPQPARDPGRDLLGGRGRDRTHGRAQGA